MQCLPTQPPLSSRLQGWFGDLQLPCSVQQQGSLALTALAAICAHLKRMRAEQELAGGSQLVMPYEVYAGTGRMSGVSQTLAFPVLHLWQ